MYQWHIRTIFYISCWSILWDSVGLGLVSQWSKKVKTWNYFNGENNKVNLLGTDKQPKVSTVTSLTYLPLKGSKVKISNVTRSTYWAWTDMQKYLRWPCHWTYGHTVLWMDWIFTNHSNLACIPATNKSTKGTVWYWGSVLSSLAWQVMFVLGAVED